MEESEDLSGPRSSGGRPTTTRWRGSSRADRALPAFHRGLRHGQSAYLLGVDLTSRADWRRPRLSASGRSRSTPFR